MIKNIILGFNLSASNSPTIKKINKYISWTKEYITLTPKQQLELDEKLSNSFSFFEDTQQSKVLKMLKAKYPYMSNTEELSFEEAGEFEFLVSHVAVRDMIKKGTLRNLTLEEIARYVAYGEYDTKGNVKPIDIFPSIKTHIKKQVSKEDLIMTRVMVREENGIQIKEMLLALGNHKIAVQDFVAFCVRNKRKINPIITAIPYDLSYPQHREKYGNGSVLNIRYRDTKESLKEFDTWLKNKEFTREEFFRGILHNYKYHLKRYLAKEEGDINYSIGISVSEDDFKEFSKLLKLHGINKKKMFTNAFGYALETLRGL